MDRRSFLATVAASTTSLVVPSQIAACDELVIDYASTDPLLFRTIAYDVNPVHIPSADVVHMPPAGVSNKVLPNFTYYDVKRAWILPDGRLKLERWLFSWVSDADGHRLIGVDVAGNEPQRTMISILDRWRLVTVDASARTVKERCSQRM